MINKIEIRNLTIIINLIKSSASSYLNFMEESKKIKILDTHKIITSSKINNQFLIIYVDNIPNENLIIKHLTDSLINNKIDFIAIDELFPNDNSALLNRKDCSNKKTWLKAKIFDSKSSFVNVKL